MVWSLRHFPHLIHSYPIQVRTDHAAVVELFDPKLLTGKISRWALIIQDFNLSFKANVMEDALSRHIAILHALGEGNFREKLRNEQKTNPFCALLIYYLESGDDTQLSYLTVPLLEFRLEDNALVRLTTLSANHESDREVKQMVIPNSLVLSLIKDLHASHHAGHPGKARSLHQARLEYCWPTMSKDINSFSDKCQTYTEYKGSAGRRAPLKSYPIP